MIDVDSFVGEVCGRLKWGAGYGYTRLLGYHPILTTRADTREALHIRRSSATSPRSTSSSSATPTISTGTPSATRSPTTSATETATTATSASPPPKPDTGSPHDHYASNPTSRATSRAPRIARGVIPGPRILTSLRPVNERTGTPAQIREFVDKVIADGADLIKVFATNGIQEGI